MPSSGNIKLHIIMFQFVGTMENLGHCKLSRNCLKPKKLCNYSQSPRQKKASDSTDLKQQVTKMMSTK